eukprot:scaffold191315_cov48-Cyclotella_meneghiniana.AAC.1
MSTTCARITCDSTKTRLTMMLRRARMCWSAHCHTTFSLKSWTIFSTARTRDSKKSELHDITSESR